MTNERYSKLGFALLVLVVSGVVALIACRVFVNPVRLVSSSEQIQIPGKQTSRDHALHETIVAKVIDTIEGSDDPKIVDRLRQDIAPLLAVVLEEKSGDEYLSYFTGQNLEFNQELAEARLVGYRKGPYRNVPTEEWESMSVSERYSLVIGTGSQRGAGWESVGMDGIKAGLSRNGWPAAPEGMKSALSFSAFYHPKEVPDLLAWVDISVELAQSTRCLVRLVLRWDEEREVWVPYAGISYTYGGTMPFLII